MSFIQVKNKEFMYNNQPIRLRGFGIGTWLCLEHFMMGMPTAEESMRLAFSEVYGEATSQQFFRNFQGQFLQEADFQFLSECGVNFVRVPFNYRLFIDDNETASYKEDGFLLLDKLFALCKKYRIFAMIDLHAAPGSQNPDWHSDNSYGAPLFWKYQVFRRQMTQLWQAIAARYHDEPYLMGYDLLNEPAMGNWPAINEFYEETIAAIRTVDTNHIIILEGDLFSMDFSGLSHFEDPQIAMGFHYYPTVWHPDLLDETMTRSLRNEKIAEGLTKLVAIQETFHCPVLCGEFGYAASDIGDGALTYELIEDTIALLEEHRIGWTIWCYKDAQIMSIVSPKSDSPWMQFAAAIKHNWQQASEKNEAAALLALLKENWYGTMTEEEAYTLQFRLRAAAYLLHKNHILIPELKKYTAAEIVDLPNAFAFPNCQQDERFTEIITQVLNPSSGE